MYKHVRSSNNVVDWLNISDMSEHEDAEHRSLTSTSCPQGETQVYGPNMKSTLTFGVSQVTKYEVTILKYYLELVF